ncbi:MAG: hypothetical protein HDS56_05465 [Barnesiella sp.]|nr:hypothetical protein [Bacteroidales bacterium]MBD5250603.1 hypothetical protein [Barnesiella sp.]
MYRLLDVILLSISNWMQKIWNFILSIGDFFVLMWNDEDRWWCIAGFLLFLGCALAVLISVYSAIIAPIVSFFKTGRTTSSNSFIESTKTKKYKTTNICDPKVMKVTIKGVYQMNGPKPFIRIIECSSSETGYYSQLMGNKSKQAQWIQANFPGADTARGFSMSINIK